MLEILANNFTFHNVSIKTFSGLNTQASATPLYIPQCFY